MGHDLKTPSKTAIKSWRIARGLSQEEAAALVGVTRQAWSRWETSGSVHPLRVPALVEAMQAVAK